MEPQAAPMRTPPGPPRPPAPPTTGTPGSGSPGRPPARPGVVHQREHLGAVLADIWRQLRRTGWSAATVPRNVTVVALVVILMVALLWAITALSDTVVDAVFR